MKTDPNIFEKLYTAAKGAADKAYCPYSKFPVGAAILTDTGHVFTGSNVENASYGLTICAERAAVVSAVSSMGHDMKITRVAIYTPTEQPTAPCGACRQVLNEFGKGLIVTSTCASGKAAEWTMDRLLPHSFGSNDLL